MQDTCTVYKYYVHTSCINHPPQNRRHWHQVSVRSWGAAGEEWVWVTRGFGLGSADTSIVVRQMLCGTRWAFGVFPAISPPILPVMHLFTQGTLRVDASEVARRVSVPVQLTCVRRDRREERTEVKAFAKAQTLHAARSPTGANVVEGGTLRFLLASRAQCADWNGLLAWRVFLFLF